MDVTRLHEENIREALKKSLIEFNNSEWSSKIDSNGKSINVKVAHSDTTLSDIGVISEQNKKKSTDVQSNLIGNMLILYRVDG